MKSRYFIFFTLLLAVFFIIGFISCENAEEIDTEKPSIDLSIQDAFPINCDTLYFGESFEMKVLFEDNFELGSYSVDIHNNFDHHSHTTEVNACQMDDKKTPVNPFIFINDFEIPENNSSYQTKLTIEIPESNSDGFYDDGDYHFFISLTDKEGWSAQKGLSIKILHR